MISFWSQTSISPSNLNIQTSVRFCKLWRSLPSSSFEFAQHAEITKEFPLLNSYQNLCTNKDLVCQCLYLAGVSLTSWWFPTFLALHHVIHESARKLIKIFDRLEIPLLSRFNISNLYYVRCSTKAAESSTGRIVAQNEFWQPVKLASSHLRMK